jgi:hypothetical protein
VLNVVRLEQLWNIYRAPYKEFKFELNVFKFSQDANIAPPLVRELKSALKSIMVEHP